ncbi:cache domain-containing sensor histidine kinase, partial [Vibrio diazotrophicus]|uniref:cache domain-containing sensor histidine kinase n=1 Tax=Vibrio diazotrophicus TaxID=685 RepID=UPI00142D5018
MLKFSNVSIKAKVVAGITFAVLASTIIVGVMAQRQARDVLEHRLVDIELPSMLKQISSSINSEVTHLLLAAEQITHSEFIKKAIATKSIDSGDEAMLVKQLNNIRTQFKLNDASVANRKTAYYWNQNGFLRELNKQQDGWFYGFLNSGHSTMVSMFQEPTGEVKMFANFQDVNGDMMSGLSKSMDDMVKLLNGYKIEKTGYVFLTDAKGEVQIHREKSKAKSNLNQLFGAETNKLLNKSDFNLITAQHDGVDVFVASYYVKSMDWFVVGTVPVNEVFADLNDVAQRMLITTIIVAAIFIAMGLILASSIANPIRQIAIRFTDLGKGDGDLSQRIEIEGNDEIAQLSSGFNGFIEKIHQSMKEVASTSHSLQEAAETVSTKA